MAERSRVKSNVQRRACRWEQEIAAYLDGELDQTTSGAFETHLAHCRSCAEQLNEQKRLLCLLDASLDGADQRLAVPVDFASVVMVRARSDVRHLRSREERRRALWFALSLLGLSLVLLWSSPLGELLEPLHVVSRSALCLLKFVSHALIDVGTSVAVLGRLAGQLILPAAPWLALAMLVLASAAWSAAKRRAADDSKGSSQ